MFWDELGSIIESSVFSTSSIRFAETSALGSIIETIEIIKNDITICIVYCINAIRSPTCILPSLICLAPIHTIRTEIAFIINIIDGIIHVIILLTKRFVLVRSLLASSNLFSSCFSVVKALITGSPVRISLAI